MTKHDTQASGPGRDGGVERLRVQILQLSEQLRTSSHPNSGAANRWLYKAHIAARHGDHFMAKHYLHQATSLLDDSQQ